MISDEIIKDKFIADQLTTGVNKVLALQAEVVEQVLSSKTGRLLANLSSRPFGIDGSGQHFMLSVSILNYLRFNEIRDDMALRGKLHLYNRIVWGVLYGETLPTIKYGLTDEIRESIRKQIEDAGVQLSINFEL